MSTGSCTIAFDLLATDASSPVTGREVEVSHEGRTALIVSDLKMPFTKYEAASSYLNSWMSARCHTFLSDSRAGLTKT
jgi:hypothetical protein